ncbi:hypothetical protein SODALDRAFT_159112 [Sodiomyces alkalinus F11]|uniref:Uncharacterized protein n=1 Tax=Sodiomyces alkalinus (strain CBS 110278 / VKM F-3762 / F11) TaxID=1314773 RepID=A0A3N2PY10_SODAK|nr:hypothetical protein SODALDRAFT_159112 [Sodiomyces alkalinus F11]ROT39419.1 hypothetical protein SODALDRAFT_159112 [Sodiomyces alkalinus F11]
MMANSAVAPREIQRRRLPVPIMHESRRAGNPRQRGRLAPMSILHREVRLEDFETPVAPVDPVAPLPFRQADQEHLCRDGFEDLEAVPTGRSIPLKRGRRKKYHAISGMRQLSTTTELRNPAVAAKPRRGMIEIDPELYAMGSKPSQPMPIEERDNRTPGDETDGEVSANGSVVTVESITSDTPTIRRRGLDCSRAWRDPLDFAIYLTGDVPMACIAICDNSQRDVSEGVESQLNTPDEEYEPGSYLKETPDDNGNDNQEGVRDDDDSTSCLNDEEKDWTSPPIWDLAEYGQPRRGELLMLEMKSIKQDGLEHSFDLGYNARAGNFIDRTGVNCEHAQGTPARKDE